MMKLISTGGAQAEGRFSRVLPVLPSRITLHSVDCHVAHHPIAAGDFDREACKRRQSIGETWKGLAPNKGLHAAH